MPYTRTIMLPCLLSLLIYTGCTTTMQTDRLTPPETMTVALPYVEAVHIPAEVLAGQPFTITVDLSCAMHPEVLHSPGQQQFNRDHFVDCFRRWDGAMFHDEYSAVLQPYRDPVLADPSLPEVASVAYTFSSLPAGEHQLHYLSAPTREQGGMSLNIIKIDGAPLNLPDGANKSIPLTVLP